MVTMSMMPECRRGEHDKCPETESAAPGEFGGWICVYLQQFPNGRYSELARQELARLKKN